MLASGGVGNASEKMPSGISSPSYIREKLSPLGLYIVARNIGNPSRYSRRRAREGRLEKLCELLFA